MRRLAPLLAVLVLVGCGGDDDPGDPGVFVTSLIPDLGAGEVDYAAYQTGACLTQG